MKHVNLKCAAAVIGMSLAIMGMWSCTQEKKPEAQATAAGDSTAKPEAKTAAAGLGSGDSLTTLDITPGEAGGVLEDTFTASAKVSAIDPATRKVTLAADDGSSATFTAGPEIRNFDRLHVGDTVTATVNERLVVFVRSSSGGGDPPSVSHAAALARAPKGAKPGALIGESFEIVATIAAIDPDQRTATLKFFNGETRTVPVRADVDLSRYKVGDSVVIRITEALSVLVQKP